MYNNYDRGGMDVEIEEKHHKGGAILMMLFAAGWISAYAYWLNYVTNDCCVWWYADGSDTWG